MVSSFPFTATEEYLLFSIAHLIHCCRIDPVQRPGNTHSRIPEEINQASLCMSPAPLHMCLSQNQQMIHQEKWKKFGSIGFFSPLLSREWVLVLQLFGKIMRGM